VTLVEKLVKVDVVSFKDWISFKHERRVTGVATLISSKNSKWLRQPKPANL
jgi:hypothetical protein